jgi:hypothetical protein
VSLERRILRKFTPKKGRKKKEKKNHWENSNFLLEIEEKYI